MLGVYIDTRSTKFVSTSSSSSNDSSPSPKSPPTRQKSRRIVPRTRHTSPLSHHQNTAQNNIIQTYHQNQSTVIALCPIIYLIDYGYMSNACSAGRPDDVLHLNDNHQDHAVEQNEIATLQHLLHRLGCNLTNKAHIHMHYIANTTRHQ